jgi:hypothetical protein
MVIQEVGASLCDLFGLQMKDGMDTDHNNGAYRFLESRDIWAMDDPRTDIIAAYKMKLNGMD